GIEQVNQAITQMDETTQQNAALVEQATAAARSMEQQAGQMVQAVSVFRSQRAQQAPSASSRASAAAAARDVRRVAVQASDEAAGALA
ncbi:MAG TPA: methyl-accepting chemotaxis protein, partial [Luteimonas sp.]|nr:methyl-accepting chemotaxis protein [Luteimonas sp.]